MEVFLSCIFVIAIIILIFQIIDFSVKLIIYNKQMSTRNYDIESILDRLQTAEKQFQKNKEDNKMETTVKCEITDLLKDYVKLHERIKTLYMMLEFYDTSYYCLDHSTYIKNKNRWQVVGNSIIIETIDVLKLKYGGENTSVRNNNIREIKKEIKRYHRLQSNIQNVLNSISGIGGDMVIYRQYNTEKVPSQFKNKMNYTYYISNLKTV